MRKFAFLILLSLIGWSSVAQTNVSGNYFTDQIWSLSGNPYIVTGAITIVNGATLTIQPGVILQNSGDYLITIKGTLIANGSSAQPITADGGKIMFRKTNLSSSQISYFTSNGTSIQLADEGEFTHDFPTNSGILEIYNSGFSSANLWTKGYQTTAALRLINCTITNNTDVRGVYPRSEPIYLENCKIANSVIYSEPYNAGIFLNNCNASATNFYAGCCGGKIGINYSTLINSTINSGIGSPNYYCSLNNSFIINTSINIDATSIQNCIFKYNEGITLNLGATSISNSSFIGNHKGRGIEGMSGDLTGVTVVNNNIGAQISLGTISGSNFFNNSSLNVKHTSSPNVNATGNYWGTVDPIYISDLVFDYWDDTDLGPVDYSNYAASPNTSCPIKPPANIRKQTVSGGILVSWSANPEPDLAGYKIYYGTTDGINFDHSIDVGNVISSVLSGLSVNDSVFVTAYDSLADGTTDMIKGHESWYSDDSAPNVVINNADTITICQGTNTTLNANNFPDISYQWQRNGANISSDTDSLSVNQSGVYRVIETKLNGWNDTSNSITVIVKSFPGNAETISGSASVCQGQNSITYTIPSITNAASYVWTLPADATGTSTTNSLIIDYGTSAVSGNIIVKGNNSCGDGTSSTLAVTVNPLPLSAEAISGTATVCPNQNYVTYAVPAIPNATSYVWSIPSGATGTSTTNNITVSYGAFAVSGNMTVKGNNSCGDGASSTLAIIVNPLPDSAGTISGTTTVCQDQNLITYSAPAIANATSYIWSLPGGVTGTSATNNISVDYGTSAISGNITVKGNNSCGHGTPSALAITVINKPATPLITLNGNVLLSDALDGIQWYDQNGLINGATNQYYIPTGNGNGDYYVVVTINGCSSDPSNTINVISTGIAPTESDNTISIYPNPVSDELVIEVEGNKEKIEFEIFNSIGQTVCKGHLLEKATIETTDFKPGFYLIKLKDNKTVEFKKMMKE